MNKELLLKVKEQILREPKQFLMEDWFTNQDGLDHSYNGDRPDGDLIKAPYIIPNCGTAACIAGWALSLAVGTNPKDTSRHFSYYNESREASSRLDIDKETGKKLFFFSLWPRLELGLLETDTDTTFTQNYTPEQRAEIAARRIDLFIESNGEV